MAWTSPATYVTGTILQASQLNLIRDNLLATGPAVVTTAGDLVVATGANALARLGIGATADVLQVVAGVPAWGGSASGWLVQIMPELGGVANTNWSTIVSNTGFGGALMASSGVQNDEITWPVALTAGTWTFTLVYGKDTDAGIVTVQLDGASQGTIDTYAAQTFNNVSSLAGLTVATSGKKVLRLLMATKNASSSAYRGRIQGIQLVRTA